MKMTLLDVGKACKSLSEISGKVLPHKISYSIAKNLITLRNENKLIEQQKLSIAKRYAELDENGNFVTEFSNGSENLKINDMNGFVKEFSDFLVETETEIQIATFPESAFDALENGLFDALSPEEYVALNFMVENSSGK